ncbi:unnamed protein product [Meloidogyne enterolobii]|uniref:Uncharacterized protein n=3 Tax=Meloidogyne enterolobii TaxID=390850 RepID=A0A6V7XL72_MELEN|nr:unnamed protein product [Meloidogyne enterolobii]
MLTKWRNKLLIEYIIYREWLCGPNNKGQNNLEEDSYCINSYLDEAWKEINKYYWYGEEALLIIINSEGEEEDIIWNIIFKIYLEPEEYSTSQLDATAYPSFLQASLDALMSLYNKKGSEEFKNVEEWHKFLLNKNKGRSFFNRGRWNDLIKTNLRKNNLLKNNKGRRHMHTAKLLNLLKENNEDINPEILKIRETILSATPSDLEAITDCSAQSLIDLSCNVGDNLTETVSESISEISESSSIPKNGQSFESPSTDTSILNYRDNANEIEEVLDTNTTTDDNSSIFLQDISTSEVGTSVSIPSNSPSFLQHLDYEMKAFINFEDLFAKMTNKKEISEDYLLQMFSLLIETNEHIEVLIFQKHFLIYLNIAIIVKTIEEGLKLEIFFGDNIKNFKFVNELWIEFKEKILNMSKNEEIGIDVEEKRLNYILKLVYRFLYNSKNWGNLSNEWTKRFVHIGEGSGT